MTLRSTYHTWKFRFSNRLQDMRAVLAGACNASTWTGRGLTGRAGGYAHWRCGKPRGHAQDVKVFRDGDYVDGATYGPHRFMNYTWTGKPGDPVEFNPLPVRRVDDDSFHKVLPFAKLAGGRHIAERRAHQRYREQQERIYHAVRNAEKRGS